MEYLQFIQFVLAGAGVGLAVGLTGIGGGSLMTPLLIMFGIPYNIAIGTDLIYAALTKAGGVAIHQRKKNIRWDIVLALGAGSIPASLLTAYILKLYFADSTSYQPILTTSLGIMLIITSVVILFKQKIQTKASDNPGPASQFVQKHNYPVTFCAGLLLGVCVTLSSVGAGAFGTAVLLILYPRLSTFSIIGTDLAHAVPLTLIAGLGHLIFLGNVDFLLLFSLLLGSIPAVYIGTHLGSRLPEKLIQPILACTLLLLGLKFAIF
jgi:hypothetical protein